MKNEILKEEIDRIKISIDDLDENPDEFTPVMASLSVIVSEIRRVAKAQGFSDSAIDGALILAFTSSKN